MTLAEIREAVAEIASNQDDNEVAHANEDALYIMVLKDIADGLCADPAACAREAIKANDLSFERWYA